MPRNNNKKSSLTKLENNDVGDSSQNFRENTHTSTQSGLNKNNHMVNTPYINQNSHKNLCHSINGLNSQLQNFQYGVMQNSAMPNHALQLTQQNSDLTMQYINLMIEKQNFALSRFDHIEGTLNRLIKENTELKETVKILTNNSEIATEQLNDIMMVLTSSDIFDAKKDDKDYDDYDDEYRSCGDPTCEGCHPDNHDDCDDFGDNNLYNSQPYDYTEPKKKKSKKSKKNKLSGNDIVMNIQGDFPPNINPLQLLEQIIGIPQKKEQKDEDVCSDDGYDQNAPIYENPDENKEVDSNFVELTDALTNINDLIVLGEKYKDAVGLAIKKKEKKIKKKAKYMKTSNAELLAEKSSDNLVLNLNEPQGFYELDGKKYPVNLETISKLAAPLTRLSKMIGMDKVKDDIFDMIIYYLQGFEKNNSNMLHSVIEGPPGVGKTKLGKILASVYCGLGIIPSNKFKYVKATDLIGDHVGATKHMTQSVIDEADGGVLFIDEAYALSSNDNKDPYGKECIDTINFNLSENKRKLIVIIAGYPDHLDKYFFSFNPGLARRFPFKFRIDAYTPEELKEIFIDKLRKFGWKFTQSVEMNNLSAFFKTNEKEFPNFGGDVENFFKSCQFAHSKRMIGKNPNQRKKLNFDDLKKGLEKFKKNKRNDDTKSQIWKDMFI